MPPSSAAATTSPPRPAPRTTKTSSSSPETAPLPRPTRSTSSAPTNTTGGEHSSATTPARSTGCRTTTPGWPPTRNLGRRPHILPRRLIHLTSMKGIEMPTATWLDKPEAHDFPAAADYLGILTDPATVTALTDQLHAATVEHKK